MSLEITSPDPIDVFVTAPVNTSGNFTFSYTPPGAFISPDPDVLTGTTSITNPTTHQTYTITFHGDFTASSYGGGTGSWVFDLAVPAGFLSALTGTAFAELDITLYALDPSNNYAVTGQATESIDLFMLGTGTPPPPPPPKLTPQQKMDFHDAADTLSHLSDALAALGAATDPLHPVIGLAGALASALTNQIDPQVGLANSAVQTALSLTSNAIDVIGGSLNPAGLTLFTASVIDGLAALALQALANDPPDGNFTSVYQAPDWSFGTIAGVGTVANTLLTDSWKMLQDTANMLEAAERYQGAEYAADTASQTLQMNAFNTAFSAFNAQEHVVSADLQAYGTQLQGSISDVNLSTDNSFANAQAYLKGLANPLTDDPILKAFISSIDTTAPNLAPVINGDVQQALTALETMQAPALTGSAFTALSSDAGQLVTAGITPATIQADYFGITRTALPLDQATTEANAIIAGTTTETQYVNTLLGQVADSTIPVVAVEASMYGAVGSSSVIANLVTNFLPGQLAYAMQVGLDPQVFACLETALVFAFANETGSTGFANNFGPSNAATPGTVAGDAAFAAAATNAIFGSAQTANTTPAILGYVHFLEGFFTANGIVGVQNPTADQIVIAARAGAWGEGVAIALENHLGSLPGQTTNFLEDAAQGTAIYSASLSSQPTAAPFQGAASASVATTASDVQVTGVAAPIDHIVL